MGLILFLLAAVATPWGLFSLAKKNKIKAEQLLLVIVGVAMAAAVASAWGDYGNVHGGAILLVAIMLFSMPILFAEFILLSMFRTRARLFQCLVTLLFPVSLICLAFKFGSGG